MPTKIESIYPAPLTLPPADTDNEGQVPVVSLQRFGGNGDGRDGDLITAVDVVVNKYAGLTRNNYNDYPSGSRMLEVDSTSDIADFAVGDEILIAQMQVFRSSNPEEDLGKYEFATIESISGDQITIVDPLTNTFLSDDDGNKFETTKTQIVKVAQYNSILLDGANIVADQWDGYKGGMVVVKCVGDITGTGQISVLGLGYRGAPKRNTSSEGFMGMHAPQNTEYYGAGGGYNSGFGGSHRTLGHLRPESGGTPNGTIFGTDDSLRITFGGAGGGGYNVAGGNGGGAIMLYCGGQVEVDLTAAGAEGVNNNNNYVGGSGAGGKILLFGNTINSVATNGGDWNPSESYNPSGGLGGEGYYRNDPIPPPLVSVKYRTPITPEAQEAALVVADISARDASPEQGMIYVSDASADATVDAGGALYIWDGGGSTWVKLAEFESMDLVMPTIPPLGVTDWKTAVNGETVVNGMGYIIDAEAGPIVLNLPVPTVPYSFQFGYRVINVDNDISFNTGGAFWEGTTLVDNILDITENNVSGSPVYHGAVKGWIETDLA